MRIVARVDGQGFFVADVLLEDDEPTPPDCVETRPPNGMYAPRWTGTAWEDARPLSPIEVLEQAQQEKIAEFGERAMEDLSPLWTPHRGIEETLHAVLEYLIPILEAQRITVDQRLYVNRDIGRKALTKKQQVEAATTPEEVEAIVWEEPPATLESYPDPPLGPRRPGKKK